MLVGLVILLVIIWGAAKALLPVSIDEEDDEQYGHH